MEEGTVLVALDGSPIGSAVLPYAEALATVTRLPLRLFSVVANTPSGHSPAAIQFAEERQRAEHRRLRHFLAETSNTVRAHGLMVSTAIVAGEPTDAILAEAAKPDVRLVALSTQGRSGLERWVLGSVADKVMRLSPKPVLLVRPPYFPLPQRTVTLRNLLVPLDGSLLAEQALPLARTLLTTDVILWLVRVEPWQTEPGVPYGPAPEFPELDEEVAAEAEAYLAEIRSQLGSQDTVRTLVLRGRPAQSLVDFALHDHIDLAVMTTHGAGGLRRLVQGSTADFVVRSGVPTLLVRPETAREEDTP